MQRTTCGIIEKLPEQFQKDMASLLGPEEYGRYLECFRQEKIQGLRVNTGKIQPEDFAALCSQDITPIPWTANGFYYHQDLERDSAWEPAKDPYYHAGLYYLQEPSAMAPASFLPVRPGDRVLDLCAAPGGKATELGAKLKGQGMLFANDISNSRAKALLKNLELSGIWNFCVTSEPPERLAKALPGFFHQILVDAPCSGEGMFRKDPDMAKDWEMRGPSYYAPIQKEILHHAVTCLKPGGYLLYSTCTFSKTENEDQIHELLAGFPEMELVRLPLFPGASEGFGLFGVIRLFPHKIKGEGHFLALLRKKEGDGAIQERLKGEKPKRRKSAGKYTGGQQVRGEFDVFLETIKRPFESGRIYRIQNSIYYLPEAFPEGTGLRFLRTGLLLGQEKGGRFEPSQAFAMALKPEEFPRVIRFSHDDGRVIRYLKGETISLTEQERCGKGWCLVCVEDFPLGWAKSCGETLKNKYYPGWRYQ